MSRDGQQALSARGLCGPLVLLALLSSSRPSPPPWPPRHFFLHPPCPAFSYCAVRPPFGDLHGCPAPFGWRSRYRCVNLDVAVALPVPAVARASVRVIGSVSVASSCSAVAFSARAVRDFAPPACRPSVSPPAFVVIVAVAKALRSLDSLVYSIRCVVPVYILILCARFRSLPFSIVVASVDCGAVSALASVLLVSPAVVPCLSVLAIVSAVVYLFIVSPAASGIAVGFLSPPFLPAPLAVWC
ncbi:hypothetical protein EMIHUDRAFT_230469 [Emiliania huxleyi CCMP1516]|uniref:Uncharacterized protein n=2 Tax=Emiliania huxleyi TaxID=2903 RepID=A0A0D3KAA5_EMIH1|nr:hypothetical protein EMIHUDRAFT_230469 [Emiliania huxleyi CCMP1516]EOD32690.1 hypothetical protein EMIHUDRAFT_230469 [Emiliania huxleyi CCMP1516]|eukprot:XP_005785119.1 hypothetical protein EMIHUDRAFT_230469 [Emiliania huxleyi CCMP1516]